MDNYSQSPWPDIFEYPEAANEAVRPNHGFTPDNESSATPPDISSTPQYAGVTAVNQELAYSAGDIPGGDVSADIDPSPWAEAASTSTSGTEADEAPERPADETTALPDASAEIVWPADVVADRLPSVSESPTDDLSLPLLPDAGDLGDNYRDFGAYDGILPDPIVESVTDSEGQAPDVTDTAPDILYIDPTDIRAAEVTAVTERHEQTKTTDIKQTNTMSYQKIRDRVAAEIALQDSLDNQVGERWIPSAPSELFTADEHTKIYLPRLEAERFDHTIVVNSLTELADIIDAASELAGGYFSGKDTVIKHEAQHAEAAERLGGQRVRFLARLVVSAPFTLPDGRRVRNLDITPSTLLDDVRTSRLGVGLFLGFPEDTAVAPEDTNRIQTLGYKDAHEVIRRAADFNERTGTNTYPLPRRTA